MNDFTTTCNSCGGAASTAFLADFDTVQNALVSVFNVVCQKCNKHEQLSVTVPKRDLLPTEADEEVKAAIAEVLGDAPSDVPGDVPGTKRKATTTVQVLLETEHDLSTVEEVAAVALASLGKVTKVEEVIG